MPNALPFLFLLAFPLLSPANPAVAVEQAREHIAAKRYAAALDALQGALADLDQVSTADRDKAAAAVHFYLAVAFSGAKEDEDATAHLLEFFRLVPNARLAAPEKYDGRFVTLFRKIQPAEDAPRDDERAIFHFDRYYPGFSASHPTADGSESTWFVALSLLASKAEKQKWSSVIAQAERERFMDEFWQRRDPTPDTPGNEFRETFNHRVAFADSAFTTPDARGSVSDRGRVFVLLGVPSSVRRRPLTASDPIIIVEDNVTINGTLEQWVYRNDQLPIRIAKPYLSYRFVSQRGIGDNILQREESYAVQALLVAMNPNELKKKDK